MSLAKDLVFTDPVHSKDNWFYNKYYYSGANLRYHTFQIALNMLQQYHTSPLIVETGCQRQQEDVGAGMSTSMFAEFVQRYGGSVVSVDNSLEHLSRAREYIKIFPEADCKFAHSDSVLFLEGLEMSPSLLYLDSLDYPIGDQAGDVHMQNAAQDHCLAEFKACEKVLENCILLIDDNSLPQGGKAAKLKLYLIEKGWVCLADWQQSLWVKGE